MLLSNCAISHWLAYMHFWQLGDMLFYVLALHVHALPEPQPVTKWHLSHSGSAGLLALVLTLQ